MVPTWLALTFALFKKSLNWLPEFKPKKFKEELANPTSHQMDDRQIILPNRRRF